VSALTGLRVRKVLDAITDVERVYEQTVSTGEFNRFLKAATARFPMPRSGRRGIKMYYGTQSGVKPPTFVLFTNAPSDIPDNYMRYLERAIRDKFGFSGSPIRLNFKLSPKR
jgi:GTP-binding protein